MKVYILNSPTTQSIISYLKENNIEVEILDKITNPQQIEVAVMGENMIVIPKDADDALTIIIGYCNEFRSPRHGKIPLVILNENNFYNPIIEDFLKEYRRIRPDVPQKEADDHYLVFRKKITDFFIQTTPDGLIKIASNLNNKPQQLTPTDLVLDKTPSIYKHEKLDQLKLALSSIVVSNNSEDFIEKVKHEPNKSALIIGAAFGEYWDYNNRDKIYQDIGEALVALGYSKIISGGPDSCDNSSGPMYHSAVGATKANGDLFLCYTTWVFENICNIEQLIKLNNIKQISFAPNEPLRQSYLINPADLVVALPGALGTFSEILAAIIEEKPVLLCNIYIEERQCYYYESFYNLLKQYNLLNKVQKIDIPVNMSHEEIFDELNKVISIIENNTQVTQSGLVSVSIFDPKPVVDKTLLHTDHSLKR